MPANICRGFVMGLPSSPLFAILKERVPLSSGYEVLSPRAMGGGWLNSPKRERPAMFSSSLKMVLLNYYINFIINNQVKLKP